ncbi:uncharacterized protein PG998_005163 [Apiospora kogelbergensis]|uniref:uncharacterized protein n=1 Tax=Apiospora kogelbergensis TaxID=1337665 RepID=UPI00312DB8F1
MKLETHHRGSKTLIRVLTPGDRINAALAVVEDQEGTGVLLQLYNLPEESEVPADYTLYPGRVGILKEPFFKATSAGAYSLRVDHVNDIVWLAPEDEKIPARWRQRLRAPNDSFKARMDGNKAIGTNQWAKAESLYSSAIDAARSLEESRLAHLNRSLANLRLGRCETALSDATKSAPDDEPHESENLSLREKRLFREAKALYAMDKYQECVGRLTVMTKEFPDNNAVKPELGRAQARLREQQTGAFSFRNMYKEAAVEPPVVDCATFTGPVEIRPSPGRGRGSFTTSAVKAGDLLICEKAFSYCFAGEPQLGGGGKSMTLVDMDSNYITIGTQARLISQIVQNLSHNPESSKKFLDLHHGGYQAVSADGVDGRPVVDSFLVTKTILANSFGAPRTSRDSFRSLVLDFANEEKAVASHQTTGVWIMASYLNHSCVGNCCRSFIGDMQIIRATRDMPANTELMFPYQAEKRLVSYDETQKKLQNWGFRCECALCLEKKATTEGTLKKRKGLIGKLKFIMGRSQDPYEIDTKRALAALDEFEATYATPVRTYPSAATDPTGSVDLSTAQITPRLDLWDAYIGLGGVLLNTDKNAEAVRVTVKGLEALGFVVVAPPPPLGDGEKKKNRKKKKKKKTANSNTASTSNGGAGADQLMVKSWGMAATSPDLAQRAREYAATAYSMLVGEKETASDELAELR